MVLNRVAPLFSASLLALALLGCSQPTSDDSANYAGTATKYFSAHGGGYVGEAVVTTNSDGNVTSAALNEWQGPSAWAAYNSGQTAFVGGEMIRFKMAGQNATSTDPAVKDYAFFYYNINSGLWIEQSFTGTTWTVPGPATGAATKNNFDYQIGNRLEYAAAYVAACKAQYDDDTTNNTDLVTVTVTKVGNNPSVTVGSDAKTSLHTGYGHLNKAAPTSTYMPITGGSIGYRFNNHALVTFFKTHPKADYNSATLQLNVPVTLTADSSIDANTNTATYTQSNDSVWAVADVTTGATYSDFKQYALALQDAYLYAIGEKKSGDLRSIK